MIKLEKYEVMGWEHAIRGMRNPMNSWDKSDSGNCHDFDTCGECPMVEACDKAPGIQTYIIGANDHSLMTKLRNAGTDHRKFMRMITVYVDITAPLYWWKEFDTYKVGTVANSCSTMHKIHAKEFTLEDFSTDHLKHLTTSVGVSWNTKEYFEEWITLLNVCRDEFLKTNDKTWWWQMIQLLPSSYNQKRTVLLNYEVLANIYKSRKNHKLDEWREFCAWIEKLPYSEIITGGVKEEITCESTQ